MINKEDVKQFFDDYAPLWDEELIKDDEIIGMILDNAHIQKDVQVLDVACGTGVLFPFYLERQLTSIVGIDISPEMVRIAREKFAQQPEIKMICGDVETTDFQTQFDAVVLYNAFPHFVDPEQLIRSLAALTKDGGIMTIAHGMSREQINAHHAGRAHAVSNGLMEVEDLAELFKPYFTIETMISNDRMYQVAGRKKTT